MAKKANTITETLVQAKRDLGNVTARERKLATDLARTQSEKRAAEKRYTEARRAVIEEFGEI